MQRDLQKKSKKASWEAREPGGGFTCSLFAHMDTSGHIIRRISEIDPRLQLIMISEARNSNHTTKLNFTIGKQLTQTESDRIRPKSDYVKYRFRSFPTLNGNERKRVFQNKETRRKRVLCFVLVVCFRRVFII